MIVYWKRETLAINIQIKLCRKMLLLFICMNFAVNKKKSLFDQITANMDMDSAIDEHHENENGLKPMLTQFPHNNISLMLLLFLNRIWCCCIINLKNFIGNLICNSSISSIIKVDDKSKSKNKNNDKNMGIAASNMYSIPYQII